MNLSMFPWWAWLLAGVVGFFVGAFIHSISDAPLDEAGRFIGGFIVFASIVSMVIGLIRFVKWVWSW
jgi:hypothetical protein